MQQQRKLEYGAGSKPSKRGAKLMISKINICNAATFGNDIQVMDGLKKFNYLFGTNGSGKTTISTILADQSQFSSSNVSWKSGLALETRVYNRDFVERNFNPQSRLKGVFTLGELESDTLNKIETMKNDINGLIDGIKQLRKTLKGEDGKSGKQGELLQLEDKYKERFWKQKQKYDAQFAGGFEGVRNSKDSFKAKVITEHSTNREVLISVSELEQKAKKVFSNKLTPAQNIIAPQTDRILAHEQNPILKKRVIGKDDVDIAAMIKKLGNSDWVRQGLSYYNVNEGVCPFCQQKTEESFSTSLGEYFDESFTKDNNAINTLLTDYSTDASRIQQQIQGLLDMTSEFLDVEKLKSEKQILDSLLIVNNQRLNQKKKEASQVIELDSLKNVLAEISELIANANKQIDEHNKIIQNLSHEKRTLTNQIWKFIVEELKQDLTDYSTQKVSLEKAISGLSTQITKKEKEKDDKFRELLELEKQTTSIQPTLDGINTLLSSFGFKSFSLAKGDDGKTYKLVRPNGADAQRTLSEGEKNFVTFLYFYHLIKGSQSEIGITTDRVIVIDDPVSSLDNEVLFIISSLIRDLIEDVRNDKGNIKQVFVLTHNIYFHKEVTYNSKRNSNSLLSEETFWLVKKSGNESIVEKQQTNPIKTSYELLWAEVRNESRSNVTLQNTLRRILENYFKLLGGISLDNLYKEFEGEDKIICKSLCSWINDGSHSAFDDYYYTPLDNEGIDKYLVVFKRIFENCNQIAHYNMMMGKNFEQDGIEEAS